MDDNSVPSIFYVDLRGAYEITGQVQVYGAIDNLFDRDPPNIAVSYQNAASFIFHRDSCGYPRPARPRLSGRGEGDA